MLGASLAGALTNPAAADHSIPQLLSQGPAGNNGPHDVRGLASTGNGVHVFFSTAERMTSDDLDNQRDVYRRTGPTLLRLSTGPAGGNGPHDSSLGGISADGTTAVFQTSEALVGQDTDTEQDLYKWAGGTTTLLSIGPNGENGSCNGPSGEGTCNQFAGMSRDGRHVFFESGGHLVDGDEETALCAQGDPEEGPYYEYPCIDVFENFDGVVRLVSTGPSDPRARVDHELGGISDDGTAAAFNSYQPLLPEDTDAVRDVYRRDGDTLSLASTGGAPPTEQAGFEFMSADGSRVIFSAALRLWERSGAGTVLRSPGDVHWASFVGATRDAEHVFFVSYNPLVLQDADSCPESFTGGCQDIYEHSGSGTRLVSNGAGMGDQHTWWFHATTFDGNKAYFTSTEALDPADNDQANDVYEYDVASGATSLISTGPADPGDTPSIHSSHRFLGATPDGSRVFFESELRLVQQDQNELGDLYERTGATTWVLTITRNWDDGFIQPLRDFFVTDDASRVFVIADVRLTASDVDIYDDAYLLYRGDLTGYPRPKGATPIRVPLVQAANACAAPNRTHGPPLAFPSCNPPSARSSNLNAGVGDGSAFFSKSVGHVRLGAVPGTPGGADDSDVLLQLNITNVWSASGTRVDYGGNLRTQLNLRITDKDGAVPSTIQDRVLTFDAPCTTTADDTVGSTCVVSTSAEAVSPGIVTEGSRAVWGLDQVQVLDGGSDGNVATQPELNQVFAVQGVFVP